MAGIEGAGELSSHATTGVAMVYLIDWMKYNPKFGWINEDAKKLLRVLSAVGAVAAAGGITWSVSIQSGDYSIHGATPAVLMSFAWECTKQFFFQQAFYDLLTNRKVGTDNVIPQNVRQGGTAGSNDR